MRSLLIALVLCTATSLAAQVPNLDRFMTQRAIRCEDVALNCQILIPEYYRAGKIDSVELFVEYWLAKCGYDESTMPVTPVYYHARRDIVPEPAHRMALLLSIRNKTFTEEPTLYRTLEAYEERKYWYRPAYWFYPQDDGRVAETFDLFTKNVAMELQTQQPHGSLQYLICEFYAGNPEPWYTALQTTYADTPLGSQYRDEIAKAQKTLDSHIAGFTGVWVPTKRLSVVGNHPVIGIVWGFSGRRFLVNMPIGFAFLSAENPYTLTDDDGNSYTSRRFKSLLIGLEPGYMIYSSSRSSFQVTTGLGYESINMYSENEEDGQPSVFVGTFSCSAGISYRHYLKDMGHGYIGIQLRYHFLNYKPDGGTNLSGDAFNIRLMAGGVSRFREQRLKRLYYRSK